VFSNLERFGLVSNRYGSNHHGPNSIVPNSRLEAARLPGPGRRVKPGDPQWRTGEPFSGDAF